MDMTVSGRPFTGVALKIISTVAFAGMATLIKYVADRYPAGEVAFFRSAFALIPVLIWAAWLGDFPTVFRTPRLGGHLLRSIAGGASMFFGFTALALLPLSDATAIGYASPLLTVVFAALLLGERIWIYRWSAVIVGLLGVMVILSDYIAPTPGAPPRSLVGAGASLVGALLGALAATQTRRLTRIEPTDTIVVYFSLFTALFMLGTSPFGWVMPAPVDWLFLVGCGICGGLGQVLLTLSYRYGDASLIAPFEYVSMIWAVIISVFLFDYVPTLTVLIGSAIVIAAGLFVIYREHRLGIERRKSKQAQTPTSGLGPQ